MSARMLAVLRCDHDGCDRRFTWSSDRETWKAPRLGDARREAAVDGWKHGVRLRPDSGPAPTFDYCPDHASDVTELQAVSP